MRTRIMCGWCHEMTELVHGGPTFCPNCGHRADLPRMTCDCPKCAGYRLAREIEEEPDESD